MGWVGVLWRGSRWLVMMYNRYLGTAARLLSSCMLRVLLVNDLYLGHCLLFSPSFAPEDEATDSQAASYRRATPIAVRLHRASCCNSVANVR